jgi:hypothetical protein
MSIKIKVIELVAGLFIGAKDKYTNSFSEFLLSLKPKQ